MTENGERSTAIEQRRDLDGLSLPQRRLLQELAMTPDPQLACEKAAVKFSTFKSWLRKSEEFGDAYNLLLGQSIQVAKEMLEGASMRAAGVYEEALTATKIIALDIKCPHCDEYFQTEAEKPDWPTRQRAAASIHKIVGLIVDRHQIEKTTVHLTFEEQLGVIALKARQRIPPTLYTQLAEKNALPDVPPEESDEIDPDSR